MAKLKLLYITTANPRAQGDFLEVSIFHGLRSIMGDNCVDYPEKKVMYHDWSETTKDELHGRGFSLYREKLSNLSYDRATIDYSKFDFVLFGTLGQYDGYPQYEDIVKQYDPSRIWYLDGHDMYGSAPIMGYFNGQHIVGNQKKNSFKRELIFLEDGVYPTGFGIPEYQIRPIDFSIKNKFLPRTVPSIAVFGHNPEMGTRHHHVFTEEEPYYRDMQESWFGLSCKKGGWDCLRHYEIMGAGALLLFRDYNQKPESCSPQGLPCFSYSSPDELNSLMSRLVVNNTPTEEYIDMLNKQRNWLVNFGTTKARAQSIIDILSSKV